jgi:ribose transport system substrate-binding protein
MIKSVVHASKVLAAFSSKGEVLGLRDVVTRTGFQKNMCFRLLYTLRECGMLEKVGDNQYRNLATFQRHPRYRIGYANPERGASFSQEVIAGLTQACQKEELELIRVDNNNDREAAFRNADRLIKERVDLAVEFQNFEAAAPIIASKFQSAGIPLIAVDVPHPGAIYFGADNYEAGLIGGRRLGQYAVQHWQGVVDEILIIETPLTGRVSRMRVDGMCNGLGEVLPVLRKRPPVFIDGEGRFKTTLGRVRNHLRTCSAKRILVAAANDPEALGALRAFQEVGREANCVVVGQNAEPEARAEMRQPGTRLIGSVAYFPEKYGEGIVRLALHILSGRPAPTGVFTKHRLITPQNVNQSYPNDFLTVRVAQEYA